MAKTTHLKPAFYIIHLFGGIRPAARALGKEPSSIHRWLQPASKNGCGGDIPRIAQHEILEVATKKKLDITPEDLAFGRNVYLQKKK